MPESLEELLDGPVRMRSTGGVWYRNLHEEIGDALRAADEPVAIHVEPVSDEAQVTVYYLRTLWEQDGELEPLRQLIEYCQGWEGYVADPFPVDTVQQIVAANRGARLELIMSSSPATPWWLFRWRRMRYDHAAGLHVPVRWDL